MSVEGNYQNWRDPRKVVEGFRVFARAGLRSLIDFVIAFPRLVHARR